MAVVFFNRNIPDECHQKMKEFAAAGDDISLGGVLTRR